MNGSCKASDSNQCADQLAVFKDNNGYKCLCIDTYYLKYNNCEPRM